MKVPILICLVAILVVLFFSPSIPKDWYANGGGKKLSNEEIVMWDTFTTWLHANGVPKIKLQLAYFPDSGRGVAASEDLQPNDSVVVIPFKVMMNSGKMQETELGKALMATHIMLDNDVLLSICLYYEKIRGDSFWKPYIDLLPTDFSNMPLFFTEEEKEEVDGPAVSILENQEKYLRYSFAAASEVERLHPEFKGIANMEGLTWAISAVRSRMWTIHELPGRTLVPLADMLNHHPQKGVALDISPSQETGTIKSEHHYKAGSEFFDKYYVTKHASDHLYFMTFGFLLNSNDVTTFLIDFNYALARNDEIRDILEHLECDDAVVVLSDSDTELPELFIECLSVLALDESFEDGITSDNYDEFVTAEVLERAMKWSELYFRQELSTYTKDNEQELLQSKNITQNMRNILTLRVSEKKVLNLGIQLSTMYDFSDS